MNTVWVTRPEPLNLRTAKTLKKAGYEVITLPVLSVEFTTPSALPGSQWPAWIVFVSRNAVIGLERAVEALGTPGGSRDGVRVATVGRQTAEEANRSGWGVTVIPETESAQGLLEALGDVDLDGAPVWIPSGNRPGSAGTTIPATLADRGAIAMSFPVYRTNPRTFSVQELQVLDTSETGAVVLHSPSAAEAVLRSRAPESVGRWKDATVISIGPSTTSRAKKLGASQIIECETPSDQGVLDALAKGTV